MVINHHSCLTLICDTCTEPYSDEYTIHFDTIDEARKEAEPNGWTVTSARILCAGCTETAACEITDHAWSDWEERELSRVGYKGMRRCCDSCGTAQYDPPLDPSKFTAPPVPVAEVDFAELVTPTIDDAELGEQLQRWIEEQDDLEQTVIDESLSELAARDLGEMVTATWDLVCANPNRIGHQLDAAHRAAAAAARLTTSFEGLEDAVAESIPVAADHFGGFLDRIRARVPAGMRAHLDPDRYARSADPQAGTKQLDDVLAGIGELIQLAGTIAIDQSYRDRNSYADRIAGALAAAQVAVTSATELNRLPAATKGETV